MRILILANDDLTSNLIFSKLFNVDGIEIAGVAFTRSYTKGKVGYSGALSLLKIMDFRYWFFLAFVVSGFKLKEFVSKIRHDHTVPSLKLHAMRNDTPILYSANFNAEEFIDAAKGLKPDLIVIRIDQILKESLLNIPKYGVFCVHSSLLPSYKGIAGEFHAITNKEKIIGTTVFQVKAKLDAGDVLSQNWFDVDSKKSLFHHIVENNNSGGKLLRKIIVSLGKEGEVNGDFYPDTLKPSYHSWPNTSDVKSFKKCGGKLLGLKGIIAYFKWIFGISHKVTDIP